ncbi:hypothetical protein [Streptomyces camelliae]|uniref:Uncharacterized protein n=1 Tax=Streptomyces camelliae TaxID=3004093 RepID=A0ABY7P1H9_9ACTN|nr:hypothetical protein [Streptomyces sp. HUAS 2-6]WBO64366.1 hypothetical protein O1G22_16760 [Streptomyces sp. HUAS 2-6]
MAVATTPAVRTILRRTARLATAGRSPSSYSGCPAGVSCSRTWRAEEVGQGEEEADDVGEEAGHGGHVVRVLLPAEGRHPAAQREADDR